MRGPSNPGHDVIASDPRRGPSRGLRERERATEATTDVVRACTSLHVALHPRWLNMPPPTPALWEMQPRPPGGWQRRCRRPFWRPPPRLQCERGRGRLTVAPLGPWPPDDSPPPQGGNTRPPQAPCLQLRAALTSSSCGFPSASPRRRSRGGPHAECARPCEQAQLAAHKAREGGSPARRAPAREGLGTSRQDRKARTADRGTPTSE